MEGMDLMAMTKGNMFGADKREYQEVVERQRKAISRLRDDMGRAIEALEGGYCEDALSVLLASIKDGSDG